MPRRPRRSSCRRQDSEALDRAARARDLIEALALHRGLTATLLAGGEGLSSRLVQQQQRVEDTLVKLLSVLPDAAHAQPDLPPAAALAAEVRELKSLPDALDPLRNFERHNLVIDQLVVLMHRAGTRGATSNGPQLAGASFILSDAAETSLMLLTFGTRIASGPALLAASISSLPQGVSRPLTRITTSRRPKRRAFTAAQT